MFERQLASVRIIEAINPIEGADLIEVASIGGWNSVVKKGEFTVGERVVFLEIDSWVPRTLAEFLFEGKTFNGVEGARLRTKKLRGVISQGLILKLSVAYDYLDSITLVDEVPQTLTEALGIQKWERPVVEQGNSKPKGNFPSFIPKTDQERVQNIDLNKVISKGETFEVTTKLDGSSMTIYWLDDLHNGVCSRNLELKEDDESHFSQFNKQSNSLERIKEYCLANNEKMAFQGELMGGKIQGNREGFNELRWFVYSIFDIEAQAHINPSIAKDIVAEIGFEYVPYHGNISLDGLFTTRKDILEYAESEPSINHKIREGVVFKSLDSEFSFKAISNRFLLKGGD